jgi:hypothetical protein
MIKKILFYTAFLCIITTPPAISQEKTDDKKTLEENIDAILSQISTTKSIHESLIEKIYGSENLNFAPSAIIAIKKSYAYLEYLTKLEKISDDEKLIKSSPLLSKIFYEEDSQPSFPTAELDSDPAWQNIQVTPKEIQNSSFWQQYIKVIICECYDKIHDFIQNSSEAQNQLSVYIPNIETAYQTEEHKKLRYYTESITADFLILEQQLIRYQKQSNDWAQKNSAELMQAVAEYKKTEMYQYLHNPEKIDSKNPVIPNPYPEYIIAYSLFAYIQDLVFETITPENITAVIPQASFVDLVPNFFNYVPEEHSILYDFIHLQNKKDSPTAPSLITMQTNKDNGVVIQSLQQEKLKDVGSLSDSEMQEYIDDIANQLFGLPIATESVLSEEITRCYGTTFDEKMIEMLQKTFSYLAYLTKKEIALNLPAISSIKKDFMAGIAQFTKEDSFVPTPECIAQPFWQAIAITSEELITSSAWQTYIKLKICDLYDKKSEFILNLGDAQQQMLPFIASIEQQYNSIEFTQLRTYSESIQLKQLIEQQEIAAYLAQCSDWKGLSQDKLSLAMNKFKQTELYTTMNNKNEGTPSKLIQEYIIFNYMISFVQNTFYDTFSIDNLDEILAGTTQQTAASPKISGLTNDNYTLLYDFLSLSVQLEQFKNTSTPEEVVVQGIKNPFKKSNAMIAKGFNKEITKPTQEKFVKATQKKFVKPAGNYLNNKFEDDIRKGFVKIVDGIGIVGDGLATGFIESMAYGAFITYTIGKGFGAKVDPKAQQARTRKNMNKHKGVISTVFAVAFVIVAAPYALALCGPFVLAGLFIGAMIVDKRVSDPFKIATMKFFEGLAFVTNKMTDGFILMSADLTYAGAFIGQSMGFKVNAQVERERVRAKLEAQRNTLNICMSVVLIIVITVIVIAIIVLTGGTAAAPVAAGAAGAGGSAGAAGGAAVAGGTAASAGGAAAAGGSAAAVGGGAVAGASITATVSSAVASFSAAVSANIAAIGAGLTATGFIFSQIANAAFTTFSAMAAVAQDRAAAKAAQTERDSVHTLWKHIEDNKYAAIYEQKAFIEELYKKHQVVQQNQITGLQFYKNYLRSGVQNLQEQISQILTFQQISLLQPDQNGCKPGDIGSPWGLITPFLNLYPSQGFLTTTQGRKDFPYAQEIAQAPFSTETSQKNDPMNLTVTQQTDHKLWANQKVIAVLDQDPKKPLEIKIHFKILHTLDEFHVGLYLGGIYHNYQDPAYLAELKKGKFIDLNSSYLAKYFVLEQREKNQYPCIALYENHGGGLLFEKSLNSSQFKIQTTYCMYAKLDKKTLTVTFFEQAFPEKTIQQVVNVQPCDQRTFGIIFSGAAVTWNVLTPELSIINPTETKQVAVKEKRSESKPVEISTTMPVTESLDTLQQTASQTISIKPIDINFNDTSSSLTLTPAFEKTEIHSTKPTTASTPKQVVQEEQPTSQQSEPIVHDVAPEQPEVLSFSAEDFTLGAGGFAL